MQMHRILVYNKPKTKRTKQCDVLLDMYRSSRTPIRLVRSLVAAVRETRVESMQISNDIVHGLLQILCPADEVEALLQLAGNRIELVLDRPIARPIGGARQHAVASVRDGLRHEGVVVCREVVVQEGAEHEQG